MTEPNVEEAIQKVKEGAARSYEVVVNAYHRRLRALVAAACPPGIEADEIAHLAFVTAFRQIHQYRPGTDFYAWLSVIARNLLLAEYKNVKRESKHRKDFLRHETT